jgi:hypothetical protein
MVGFQFGSTEPSAPQIVLILAPMFVMVGVLSDALTGVIFSETWTEEFLKPPFPDSIPLLVLSLAAPSSLRVSNSGPFSMRLIL